jgi:hypothetical protein
MNPVYSGRGRPPNAVRNAWAAERKLSTCIPPRPDEEILTDLLERFGILSVLTRGAIDGNIRSSIITGGPGTGKSYWTETMLKEAHETRNIKYDIISGMITPINLYKTAYELRHKGSVMVIDDADKLLGNEDGLNLLKALCDTSDVRTISYLAESPSLKEAGIPNRHVFDAAVMVISNVNFQTIVDEGRSKIAPHLEAMLSRSMCLDLRLDSRHEIGVWVKHVVTTEKIFEREGLTQQQGDAIINFISVHQDNLKELSLRTPKKIAQLMKTSSNWESLAKILLTK